VFFLFSGLLDIVDHMDLPLYLFHSPLLNDFALLPSPPLENSTHSSSYSFFYEKPVAYTFATPPDDKETLSLSAYWSEERGDYQVTTLDLDSLNAKGGNYVFVPELDVGYILAEPETNQDTRLAPISLTYSDKFSTSVTAPWSGSDVNELFGDDLFRSSSRVLGFAKQGDCPKCNTALSETFPSAGGADCPVKCTSGTNSANAIYRVGSNDDMNSSEGGKNFLASMKIAGDVVKSFDSSVEPEADTKNHVSFEYLCCHTDDELDAMRSVLDSIEWEPQEITFDRVKTRIDSPSKSGGPPTHYSICVFLDEESNNKMLEWVGKVEAAMADAGVPVNVARKDQEPFHSTLAVVDGSTYPVEEAMRAVNELVPPGTWTGGAKLTLTKPQW